MKTVDDVLRELKILEIQKESVLNPGETYMNFVIDPAGFGLVESVIRDFLLEHEKTAEKETMFYSEFRESDDFRNTDCIYWFDLSGNVVMPDMGDKILKYYRYKSGDLKIMIAFIEKQRKGE